MDIVELVRRIIAAGLLAQFQRPGTAAQFGIAPEFFLGATILPERQVEGNVIRDERLRYRAIIANDAARYSPVQLKEAAAMFGSQLAELAESDIGKEFTGQQYDQVRRLLGQGGNIEAQARFLGWLDQEVNQALGRLNEKHRWGALENAAVDRLGDNSYAETVAYPDPDGHRRQVAEDWTDNTVDPMDDILGILADAQEANVQIVRVIMSTTAQFKLLGNEKFANRANFGTLGYVPPNDGIIRGLPAVGDIATVFGRNGLPAPEIFDGTYEDFDGTHRYTGQHKIFFIGASGQQEQVTPVEGDPFFVGNTLGYTAIGTPQGEDSPGRIITLKTVTDDKPYRVETKGWQTSLPILESPEKIFVLDTEAP